MNIVEISIWVLVYIVMGFITYLFYKKQPEKPTLWKVILIVIIGLFCFSINLTMFGTVMKIPILPLGVWILYFFLRNNKARWWIYRPYAWLGFFMNFIFLTATLITIPIHHAIYPPDEPTTYISNVENAYIIQTHPAAEDIILQKEVLEQQLHTMSQKPVTSVEWFEEYDLSEESRNMTEMFPYQLVDASSRWGSGVKGIIYVENDGKGILIETPDEQLYFRSDVPFLEEAKEDEDK